MGRHPPSGPSAHDGSRPDDRHRRPTLCQKRGRGPPEPPVPAPQRGDRMRPGPVGWSQAAFWAILVTTVVAAAEPRGRSARSGRSGGRGPVRADLPRPGAGPVAQAGVPARGALARRGHQRRARGPRRWRPPLRRDVVSSRGPGDPGGRHRHRPGGGTPGARPAGRGRASRANRSRPAPATRGVRADRAAPIGPVDPRPGLPASALPAPRLPGAPGCREPQGCPAWCPCAPQMPEVGPNRLLF